MVHILPIQISETIDVSIDLATYSYCSITMIDR